MIFPKHAFIDRERQRLEKADIDRALPYMSSYKGSLVLIVFIVNI